MADAKKAVPENVAGDFFVDSTCINCYTCRQLARSTFKDEGDYSFVFHQPQTEAEMYAATRALLSCPTGSIGTRGTNLASTVMPTLPMQLDDNVFYCGFNSEDSFGANSYFIQHQDGCWLIDSPKYNAHLIKQIEKMGGIKYIFLTHRDDVADANKYAERFGAKRIIHVDELDAAPESEIVINGSEDSSFAEDFKIIPVPGHTRGHMVLLFKDRYLFTGDHLAYDPEIKSLEAFRRHCWYSWSEQIKSMTKLLEYRFEWVLAGHGDRVHLPAQEMHAKLLRLLEWMKEA